MNEVVESCNPTENSGRIFCQEVSWLPHLQNLDCAGLNNKYKSLDVCYLLNHTVMAELHALHCFRLALNTSLLFENGPWDYGLWNVLF